MTSPTVRIALLDDYQGVGPSAADWDSIPGSEVVSFRDHALTEDALVERLTGFHVAFGMRERTRFPKSVLERLPDLKLILSAGGMRNPAIDLEGAKALGITVCATGHGGVSSWPTAELAWGLAIALARNIPQEDRAIREGKWQLTVGTSLAGRTLGVIGLGHLGSKVAEYGRAFGMRVIAWSPNLTEARAQAGGAELATKEQLLREADVISIHMALAPSTRGLLKEADLRMMKPTAYLVNTSRGPIVEETALVRALEEGWIGGAGLDVFDDEPLAVDHPLRRAPRTILTPHLGYVTQDNYTRFFGGGVEAIKAFLAGNPVRNMTA